MIGNQPEVFATKGSKLLRFENIEPGLHAPCTTCMFGRGFRQRRYKRGQHQKNHERKEGSKRALVSGQMAPPVLKPYNDILERAGRGCVESTMCVCYE